VIFGAARAVESTVST